MPIEEYVCWSRMQTEAGQPLDRIVLRKEVERRAGDGLFAWGVGNSPSRLASTLARLETPVKAVFSIMKTKPKEIDVAPERVVAWRRYVDHHGAARRLPPNVIVTSRAGSARREKTHHAALMCRSENALSLDRTGAVFDPEAFVNVGSNGGAVGASQVTTLLRRVGPCDGKSPYRANIVADLTGSYWVKLVDPIELSASRLTALSAVQDLEPDEWLELARWVRQEDRQLPTRASTTELGLF